MKTLLRALGSGLLCAAAVQAQTLPDCAALRGLALPQAVVLEAGEQPAGRFAAEGAAAVDVSVPFCRVLVAARPAAGSDIRIEVWLPQRERWNGRLWGAGNPGFAGSVPRRTLALRVAAGYAAVGTDTGHVGDSSDAGWAQGQREKLVDYGHRATALAARHARRVVEAFHGRPAAKAYFGAYSNGGRQALLLAQRDPGLYDGIIAGAPAIGPTGTYVLWTSLLQQLQQQPRLRLGDGQWAALSAAVLGECDDQDGVADGVLGEPARCRFDPAKLRCETGADPSRCLSDDQAALIRQLYDSGLARGSEPRWSSLLFGRDGRPADIAAPTLSFWRHMVFEDPAWELSRFDAARDGAGARERLGPILDAANPDLSAFFRGGGKLILWHGWNDAVLSPWETIAYYEAVVRAVGPELAQRSVRLFMAPGVEHGLGGPGADRFGQFAAGDGDAQRGLGAALRRWVEQGEAPEQVIAVRHRVANDPASPVARSALLCAWPRVARYLGQGSSDDSGSYACRAP